MLPCERLFRVMAVAPPLKTTVYFGVTLKYYHSDALEWMFHFPANHRYCLFPKQVFSCV